MDIESSKIVTPEIIAKHIALRAKHLNIVIDAFSGIGGNSIQFAK
jgi:hypothetical protein